MGDPQAPFSRVLGVLDAHGLLARDAAEPRLRDDVGLISLGDHFDWGPVCMRPSARADGTALLTWLASHPPEQVVIVAGNHCLARVGELARFSDGEFLRAQALADAAYLGDASAARAAFVAHVDGFSSAQALSRDFASFGAAQRTLVSALLDSGRLLLAHAHAGVLFVHAGVTVDDLRVVGAHASRDAVTIAHAFNAALTDAWRSRAPSEPLSIPGLHRPGDGMREGEGMLYQRLSVLDDDNATTHGPVPRRKYRPAQLPLGLTQAIGHIQDGKSKKLLGLTDAPLLGRVRSLTVTPQVDVSYTVGVVAAEAACARVLYLDGAMARVANASDYALLDADQLRELRAVDGL